MNQRIFSAASCLGVLFAFGCGFSQTKITPQISWQKSFGGTGYDAAESIVQTYDGGYAIAGNASSTDGDVSPHPFSGLADYWVVKTSATGDLQWEKSFGGTKNEECKCMVQTRDSGFIIAGRAESKDGAVTGNHGLYDCWLVKLDQNGTLQWEKSLGGSSGEYGFAIVQTKDGGYAFGGSTFSRDGNVSYNHGDWDFWIVKLNDTGKVMWENTYGGKSTDQLHGLCESGDGGFVAAGITLSTNADGEVQGNHDGGNYGDYWVIKVDSVGNLVWQRTLGGTQYEQANAITKTTDGCYIVAGFSNSNDGDMQGNHGDYDYWIVKLSDSGNVLWQRTLGDSSAEFANAVVATPDSGCIVVGSQQTKNAPPDNDSSNNYWIVKLDAGGSTQWQKSCGGTQDDNANSVALASDGLCVVAGNSASSDGDALGLPRTSTDMNYWIVKLIKTSVGVERKSLAVPISGLVVDPVTPNPFSESATISFDIAVAGHVSVFVTDLLGGIVASLRDGYLGSGHYSNRFIPHVLPSGAYCVNVRTANGTVGRWLAFNH